MTKFVKEDLEKVSHIITMINVWMESEDGSKLSKDEKKTLTSLLKAYPILRTLYNAGDFSTCVVSEDGRHVWEWTKEDWKQAKRPAEQS